MGIIPPAFRGGLRPTHTQGSAQCPRGAPLSRAEAPLSRGRGALWLLVLVLEGEQLRLGGVQGRTMAAGADACLVKGGGGRPAAQAGGRVLDKQEREESWCVVIFPIETKRFLFLPNGKKCVTHAVLFFG